MRFSESLIRVFLILISHCTVSNAQADLRFSWADTIPLDSNVKSGRLTNGFTYYIKRNTEPKGKVAMILDVKAGMLAEDTDQIELSHFLEHMAFNGTAHFASAFQFADKIGIRLGQDINAFTGYDNTSYLINIPSENWNLINEGILLLSDFAQGMLLENQSIDAERGVLLNEIRRGGGYFQRMRDVYLPDLMRGSGYAMDLRTQVKRSRNIKDFKYESLRRFYLDWYRPDLQGIVVVGDIDTDSVENCIKKLYGRFNNSGNPLKKTSSEVLLDGSNKVIVVTDAEIPHIEITCYMKRNAQLCITYGQFRESIISKLYERMARSRFIEINKNYNLPFRDARHFISGRDLPGLDVLETRFEVDSGRVEIGLSSVLSEVYRIKKHGFTENEFNQARESIVKDYSDDTLHNSGELAARYSEHFLKKSAAPDFVDEKNVAKKILNGLTILDVNRVAKEWITDKNFDIVILAPDKKEYPIPDDSRIEAIIDQVRSSDLSPYKSRFSGAMSVNRNLLKRIKDHTFNEYVNGVGAVELRLNNGVKVVLKSTFSGDGPLSKVFLQGFGSGGARLYSGKKYASAAAAADIVFHSGIGGLNQFDLKDYLVKQHIEIRPYIYHDEVGIRGTCKSNNIEELMKLVYLYCTAPDVSKSSFLDWKDKERSTINNIRTSPEEIFNNEISLELCNYGVRKGMKNLRELDEISVNDVERIYKESFANANNLIFVITGNFDIGSMKPLVARYLGSIPYKGKGIANKNDECKDPSVPMKIVRGGVDPDKATVELYFSGDYDYSTENCLQLDALSYVLRTALNERLREKESGTYVVNLSMAYFKSAVGKFTCRINFICGVDQVDKMIEAALDEVEILKFRSIDGQVLKNFMSDEMRSMENLNLNASFWQHYLVRQFQEERDVNEVIERKEKLLAIHEEDISLLARKILINHNLKKFILLPLTTSNSN